ncbi:MAG: hypothetical protein ACFFEK_06310 [Candidatus Thorarchaeota archaeon]
MVRAWSAIARAEYQVTTSRFRKRRPYAVLILILIGFFWAILISPWIMNSFFDLFSTEIQQVLQVAYPGVIRSVMLLLWTLILVFPISYALQEVKIGQWEIMLSNNVSTRDMMFGMFLGRIPHYCLFVLFLAPLLISPFINFYQVSIIGQLFVYLVLIVFVLATLLLSTVLSTAIQAKLGESPRGNDIAKAMGIVVVLIFLLPLYSFMYFAEDFARLLGLNTFLLIPSTWPADLITWVTIHFNGVNLSPAVIGLYEDMLGLNFEWSFMLLGVYSLLVLAMAFITPDRIFSFEAGARTEKVTTVGKENIILGLIRRFAPGSRGVLIVSMLKDFGRKAQNISRVVYGIFLSILIPVMVSSSSGLTELNPMEILVFTSLFVNMILGTIGGVTFGGVGFLESKDHLWTFKSAPRGVFKFLAARIIDGFLFAIPMAILPVLILSIILSFSLANFVIMLLYAYVVICCTILIGIGITSINPAYEDTKSSAFHQNTGATSVLTMFAIIIGFYLEYRTFILFGNLTLSMIIAILPILILGPVILYIGARKISRIEN